MDFYQTIRNFYNALSFTLLTSSQIKNIFHATTLLHISKPQKAICHVSSSGYLGDQQIMEGSTFEVMA